MANFQAMVGEQTADLVITHLREVIVVGPDRVEVLGGLKADYLVHLLAKQCNCMRWRNRNGQHQLARFAVGGGTQRNSHRGAGGNPVVDDDRKAACDVKGRAIAEVATPPTFDLLELAVLCFLERSIVDAGLTTFSPSNLGASKTKSKVFHWPSGMQGLTIGG